MPRKKRSKSPRRPANPGAGLGLLPRDASPHSFSWWSSGVQNILLGLTLVAATIATYAPVLTYPFVNYDDDVYILNNTHVNSGLHWENLRWAITAFYAGNWHPLAWMSHALDCQLFGFQPWGHHLTNLALH